MEKEIRPISRALPDIVLDQSRMRPFWLFFVRTLSGAYLRFALGCKAVKMQEGHRLVDAYKKAFSGEARVILAFRHPYGDEPQLFSWVFMHKVRREARKLGVSLGQKPWARFVHGYEVPRWGGAFIRFLLPRLGAMPVHHSKMDREGLEQINNALYEGPWPLALAPEGQVNYAADQLPRLEAGTARIGLGVAARLAAEGSRTDVIIIPLSIRYHYDGLARVALKKLVARAEKLVLARHEIPDKKTTLGIAERIENLRDAAIAIAEKRYGIVPLESDGISRRLESIVEKAVTAAESILLLDRGHGQTIERVYRVRQIGWDRIFLAEPKGFPEPGQLAKTMTDRRAGEAWHAMRHMELADMGWYFAGMDHGGLERRSFDELVDYAQNVWDFCNRLYGGNISTRIYVKPRQAEILVSEAINLSDIDRKHTGKRKAALAEAQAALEEAYIAAIGVMYAEG